MSEKDRTVDPLDPGSDEDDLLVAPERPQEKAPQPREKQAARPRKQAARPRAKAAPREAATAGAGEEGAPEPLDPVRQFIRLARWILAALIVLIILSLVTLLRTSSDLSKVACINRAETAFLPSVSPQASASDLSLGRLALHLNLAKCGS